MKPRLKKIKRRQKFSDEFKKQLIEEFESGESSLLISLINFQVN